MATLGTGSEQGLKEPHPDIGGGKQSGTEAHSVEGKKGLGSMTSHIETVVGDGAVAIAHQGKGRGLASHKRKDEPLSNIQNKRGGGKWRQGVWRDRTGKKGRGGGNSRIRRYGAPGGPGGVGQQGRQQQRKGGGVYHQTGWRKSSRLAFLLGGSVEDPLNLQAAAEEELKVKREVRLSGSGGEEGECDESNRGEDRALGEPSIGVLTASGTRRGRKRKGNGPDQSIPVMIPVNMSDPLSLNSGSPMQDPIIMNRNKRRKKVWHKKLSAALRISDSPAPSPSTTNDNSITRGARRRKNALPVANRTIMQDAIDRGDLFKVPPPPVYQGPNHSEKVGREDVLRVTTVDTSSEVLTGGEMVSTQQPSASCGGGPLSTSTPSGPNSVVYIPGTGGTTQTSSHRRRPISPNSFHRGRLGSTNNDDKKIVSPVVVFSKSPLTRKGKRAVTPGLMLKNPFFGSDATVAVGSGETSATDAVLTPHNKTGDSSDSKWKDRTTRGGRGRSKGSNNVTTHQNTASNNKAKPKFIYGNYDRYYGYRNLGVGDMAGGDPRLCLFKEEWFAGARVLDVGCNAGVITCAVAERFGPAMVTGVEIDSKIVTLARKNLRKRVDELRREVDKPSHPGRKVNATRIADSSSATHTAGSSVTAAVLADGEGPIPSFPISMSLMFGPISAPPIAELPRIQDAPLAATSTIPRGEFPRNVVFIQGNYVPEDDRLLEMQLETYDVILCLSTTKWMHYHHGDSGLKRTFKKMYRQIKPGGRLILEPQMWPSYKKKKNLTPEIKATFETLQFRPEQFVHYLLSAEVGFSTCEALQPTKGSSKGFQRPVYLFCKADTPQLSQELNDETPKMLLEQKDETPQLSLEQKDETPQLSQELKSLEQKDVTTQLSQELKDEVPKTSQ